MTTPDWQVTATTIYCDAVDDEITIVVNKQGKAECTDYPRYGKPSKQTARAMTNKGARLGRQLQCQGPQCHRVVEYRDRIFSEGKEAA